ncbi:DMT family transporter [Luedemannella flava]|uniref:DMT family transporter n=1 Tax=Luedemannella flava TaxID=349316 RepID=A0ABP4YJR9_9ACTN
MAPTLALLVGSALWAYAYLPAGWLLSEMSTPAITATRFLGAGLIMLALRPRCLRALGRREVRGGLLLAVLLGVGTGLQLAGLRMISPAVSGFVSALYVVLTPFVARFTLGRRTTPATWAGALVATAGAGVLSLHGFRVELGVALTLLCAVAYAGQIVVLSEVSTPAHAYGLAVLQLLGAGVVGAAWALVAPGHGAYLPHTPTGWGWLAFLILGPSLLCYALQSWAQGHVGATRAAVIFATEPVFVLAFTALAGHELGARALTGGGLILAAVAIVEADGYGVMTRWFRTRAAKRSSPVTVPSASRGSIRPHASLANDSQPTVTCAVDCPALTGASR